MVGVSDPNSQSGHQGLVDPIQFARANQAIQMACQNLVDPASSPSQVTVCSLVSSFIHFLLVWPYPDWLFVILKSLWLTFPHLFVYVGFVGSYHCCKAHLGSLQRLSSGVFQNSQSCSPETFRAVSQRGRQYNG